MEKFSRQQTDDIFHIFFQKKDFDISGKLSPHKIICLKWQSVFSEKITKNMKYEI